MFIPTKKLKNRFEMPVYGIGTSKMGGESIPNPFNSYGRDIQALKTAIDEGVTHIDTAEIYALGNCEKIVGKAIKGSDRSKLFLVSKVHSHYKRASLIAACKNSLKRLGVNYLDLYLIHRYPGDKLVQESLSAMDDLVDMGLIKSIGISNFNLEHTKAAKKNCRHPLAATQVHYNLIFREPERCALLEYCQNNDIMLIAWRPVEKGLLAQHGIQIMDELSEKYRKTPSQIAINWLISQPNVVTLSKTGSISHLKENLGAIGWTMEQADIERLRNEFPNQQSVSGRIALE